MAQPKVFISHSSKDNTYATRLENDLNIAGAHAWMDNNELGAGNFQQGINEALTNCEWFLLVLTKNALASKWVRQEVDAAIRLKNRGKIRDLIVIKAEPVDSDMIPPLWGVFNIFTGDEAHYEDARDRTILSLGLPLISQPSVAFSDTLATILVADDDREILQTVSLFLQENSYKVVAVDNGQTALQQLKVGSFDLVILDVMMPGMNGISVLRRLREVSSVPVIIATGTVSTTLTTLALDLGADDYVVKPFDLEVFLARIRAVLRRTQLPNRTASAQSTTTARMPTITIGDLVVNITERRVTMHGHEITLEPIEYRLLAYLAQHAGQVLMGNQLLEHVFGEDYAGDQTLLQAYITRLRRKIEDDLTYPQYILTKLDAVNVGFILTNPLS